MPYLLKCNELDTPVLFNIGTYEFFASIFSVDINSQEMGNMCSIDVNDFSKYLRK